MLSLEQLRASLQVQVAGWQAMIQAFEAQVRLGEHEAIDRLEQQKQLFVQSLDKLKSEVQHSRSIAESQRQAFASAFDNAKQKFSLGRAATGDALKQQESAINDVIAKLDAEINQHLDAFTDSLGAEYVRWVDTVKAEFNAASVHFAQASQRQQAHWDSSRKAFEQHLESCRKQLENAQQQAASQAQQIPATLAAGMEQLRRAFSGLFAGSQLPKA